MMILNALTTISDLVNLDRMPRVRKPRMPRMTNLRSAICTEILKIRKAYGVRRALAHRVVVAASRQTARRERARRGKLSSMKMIKWRIRGELRQEDREDRRRLEAANKGNRSEVRRALKCLEEATAYLDIVVKNPRLIRDRRYRMWERSLDSFLSEMRSMMEYKLEPGHYEIDILELLIWRLGQMKISEYLVSQVEVRFKLKDAVKNLFEDTEKRFRRMGM